MAIYIINHKVKDFAQWKKAYDAFQHTVEGAGIEDHHVLTSADDPNHVVVIGEGAMADLQKFLESDELKAARKGAGVVGKPEGFVGK